MNIVKNAKNKNYALVWMDEMSEPFCSSLSTLSKSFDVYIYINSSANIDPVVFSNLYPIHGYIMGSKNAAEGIFELISYITEMSNVYYSCFIPDTLEECNYIVDNLSNLMSKSLFTKSIFKSNPKSYSFKENVCTNKPWWKKLFNRDLVKGMYSTHEAEHGCLLLYNDIGRLSELDKSYIRSFFSIRELVASSFNRLELTHLDLNPTEVLN